MRMSHLLVMKLILPGHVLMSNASECDTFKSVNCIFVWSPLCCFVIGNA